MPQDDNENKLHIDSDWKAQAAAERQKLAEQAKKAAAPAPGGAAPAVGAAQGQGIPPASFETLVSTLVTQALFAMGAIPNPSTGQRMQHLELARHHLDMLGVLAEKTKGNLDEEESKMLTQTLYELRSRYIQMASAANSR